MVQRRRRVGVDGEDHRDPALRGQAEEPGLELEAVRIAVHLDGARRGGERVQHLLHPAGEGIALEEQPAARVAPDLEGGQLMTRTSRRVIAASAILSRE